MRLPFLFKTVLCGSLLLASLASDALHGQNNTAPNPPPSAVAAPAEPSVRRADAVDQTSHAVPTASAVSGPTFEPGSLYELRLEDVVDVKVFEEPDLETTARIGTDGTINFPLIGPVGIMGKTPDDAARLIRGELAKDYLVNPQVTITVVEYAKRTFTVLGEVQKPGSYDMPDRRSVTLLEAIGAAGGYTHIADPANIRLKRIVAGKETIFKLDAKSMARERQAVSFEIKAGDIITVGQTFF
jgi:protein involved in polysaccharide export with SLBB domain